ncbi:MAG: universal stress protein [Planctomycetes bacterium]|nr:universal stress protein [Planctomycetota bacterium]
MFDKLLIPLDTTPLSDPLLDQIEPLVGGGCCEAMLLHVVPPEPQAASDPWSPEKARDTARRWIEERAKRLAAIGVTTTFDVVSGDPAEQILAAALRYRPSLLAMATHARVGLSRLMLGSVMERVLRRSPFPVFVQNPVSLRDRGTERTRGFRRILVPVDGSEQALRVLPFVESIARRQESEVTLLAVVSATPEGVRVEDAPRPFPVPANLAAEMEGHRASLERKGVRTHIRIEHGLPSYVILTLAEEEEVDLVAMTTHGRSGPSRWVFGSVAERVLRHSSCPLLVVRTAGFSEGAEARDLDERER